MKKSFLFLITSLSFFIALAQKQDNVWLLGYGGGDQSSPNDYFGLSIIFFENGMGITIINNQTSNLNLDGSNSSMSDSLGNLLFYSNGEKIYNYNHFLMFNGNNLNITNQNGAIQPQGILSIPYPGASDLFTVLISEIKIFPSQLVTGIKLYKNIVKVNPTNLSENQVILKNIPIIEDSIEYGQITAVKHANGLDWWILLAESHTNRYYRMLLDTGGLHLLSSQTIGDAFYAGLGQAVFSPDGKRYVRSNNNDLLEPTQLYIYDFDRCTGFLSNPIHLQYETWGLGTGCAFSPNSRFLYAINASYIFQYDLEALDLEASKTLVAEWDGFARNGQFPTTFSMAQLGPDGKIYVSCPFSNPYLHTIEYPNRKGMACQAIQRAIELPNISIYSLPNNPNFRLGPVDGSLCDTLGFDNHPLCNWRWEQEDTLQPLNVTFTDLSSYEPTSWQWLFGDNSTSQDTSPVHLYAQEGNYDVCLVVSNLNSSDTLCRIVNLNTTTTGNPPIQNRINIIPNPFEGQLHVNLGEKEGETVLYLFDQIGKFVLSKPLTSNITDIETDNLAPGMYFWQITVQGEKVKSGKVIKIKK